MTDPRISNLARIMVRYSLAIQPNERVAIFGQVQSEPLMIELFREVLRAGGHPQLIPSFSGWDAILYTEANEDQLRFVSPITELVYRDFECFASVLSETNTRRLTNVDPERQTLRSKALRPLMDTYIKRSATRELRWVLAMFPTEAYAQDAEMSLSEFEDFVYAACFADMDDPLGAWEKLRSEQARLADWLGGKKEFVVKGPNVDLMLSADGRRFESADGRVNLPDGEIYTSPVENSAQGWIRFSYPSVHLGREVEGVEMQLRDGKVVHATAKKNDEYLQSVLNIDEGARFLGEFAIGTNHNIDRFIKHLLFDEKIGGTIHLAVGFGMEELGGKNKSAIHWDFICDMHDGGQIFADGELFYDSGKFLI